MTTPSTLTSGVVRRAVLLATTSAPLLLLPANVSVETVEVGGDEVAVPEWPPSTKLTHHFIHLWAMVSKALWWIVLVVAVASIPILLHALYLMLTRFKRSHYFHFMTAMVTLDLIMLSSIIFNLFSDHVPTAMKGSVMCKLTAFVTNTATCYINWLWVSLFTQRFAHIFYSVHRKKSGTSCLESSKKLLISTGLMSVLTQVWAPFLMHEIHLLDANGNTEAMYCGSDERVINPELFKWIAAAESLITYLVPFIITVFTDFAVLAFTRESKWFTTVSSNNLPATKRRGQISLSLKIQSEESLRAAHKRRRWAIRRCLALATTQLLLNIPNYVLQLIDEFTQLRFVNETYTIVYLYADAIFYFLYLLQFPTMAIFVRLLHSNYDDSKKKRCSVQRRQRPLDEALSTSFGAEKRLSTELETLSSSGAPLIQRSQRSSRSMKSF